MREAERGRRRQGEKERRGEREKESRRDGEKKSEERERALSTHTHTRVCVCVCVRVYRHLGNVIKIPLLLFGERVNEDLIVPPAIKESARKREGKTVRNKKGVPIRICQFRKRTEKKKEGENGLSCAKFGRGQPSALLGWCTRTIYTHVHISVALVCVFAHVVYSVVCVLSCVEFILPARSPSLSLARSLSAAAELTRQRPR